MMLYSKARVWGFANAERFGRRSIGLVSHRTVVRYCGRARLWSMQIRPARPICSKLHIAQQGLRKQRALNLPPPPQLDESPTTQWESADFLRFTSCTILIGGFYRIV